MSRQRIPLVALTHPFELAMGITPIASAMRALAGDVTPSMADFPAWVLVFYFAVSILGGLGLVVGLCWPTDPNLRPTRAPIGLGVALERASLFLVAASYGGLGLAVLANNPSRGAGLAVLALVVALACLLRIAAIRRATKTVLAALERQRREVCAQDESGDARA